MGCLAMPTSLQHPIQIVGAEIIMSTALKLWWAALAGGLSWTGSSACFQLLIALETTENLRMPSKYCLSMQDIVLVAKTMYWDHE